MHSKIDKGMQLPAFGDLSNAESLMVGPVAEEEPKPVCCAFSHFLTWAENTTPTSSTAAVLSVMAFRFGALGALA
jgi:hypothetical protein